MASNSGHPHVSASLVLGFKACTAVASMGAGDESSHLYVCMVNTSLMFIVENTDTRANACENFKQTESWKKRNSSVNNHTLKGKDQPFSTSYFPDSYYSTSNSQRTFRMQTNEGVLKLSHLLKYAIAKTMFEKVGKR